MAGVMLLPVERTHMVELVGASPLRRCAVAGVITAPQPSANAGRQFNTSSGPGQGDCGAIWNVIDAAPR